METLYGYVFKGTEFNFERILIDILLKDAVCQKLNFDKIKIYS